MISNNKILTVSYGTFSCTLEGFDDSFGTMKAIAEYFRDLAADDRYFGAEPPQPDVDMLARIAQKEVSRRVEAREHEGKIVLSALEDQPITAQNAAPQAAPVATVGAVAGMAAAAALMPDTDEGEADEIEDTAPAEEVAEVAPVEAAEPVEAEAEEELESAESADLAEEVEETNVEMADDEMITDEVAEDEVAAEDEEAEALSEAEDETPAADAEAEDAQEEETFAALEEDDTAEDIFEQEDDLAEEDDLTENVFDEMSDADAFEEDLEAQAFVEDEYDIVPGQPDAEVEAFFTGSPTGTNQNDFEEIAEIPAEAVEAADVQGRSGADSIAAKLQRIRAVVSQQDEQAEDEYLDDPDSDLPEAAADLDDDLNAEDAGIFEDAKEEAVFEETQDALHAQEAEEATEIDTADALDPAYDDADDEIDDLLDAREAQEEDDIAAILSRLDRAEAEEATAGEETGDDVMAEDLDDTHGADALLDNIFDQEDAAAGDARFEEADGQAYQASAAERVEAEPVKTAAQAALEDAEAAMAASNPRARVIKVRRAELEAAVKRGDLQEVHEEASDHPDLEPAPTPPGKFGTSSLSPEDEAELARELAELEASIEMDQAEEAPEPAEEDAEDLSEAMTLTQDMRADEDIRAVLAEDNWTDEGQEDDTPAGLEEAFGEEEEDDAAYAPAPSRRDALPALDAEQGGDMSRLLAEADQQMGEPESATRRDAFAHLRAAVAAKKADDALGAGSDKEQGDDAYRNDLADVVRPRRPDRSGAKTPRPGDGGPAPLKLVAEQRIDVENPMPAGPVRPRRVAAVDDTPDLEGESFADFVNEMGAATLPQQLEAAAAYMSFIEGREHFSRPQLMTKVRQVNDQDSFSREDGLRHFGQLLRAGKIEKVKGGRFTVSEDIGFRPDHRAAS